MQRTGILLIAVVSSVTLLLTPSIPLGVPGEWVWPRLALPESLVELLDRLMFPFITAVGLVSLCRGVDAHIHRLSGLIRFLMLALLAAGSFCWINAVRQAAPSPHRELRPLWVLYDQFASGYFQEAAFRTTSQAELLSTYEARMAEGDVLHEGTHPPGLFLLNWWAIQVTAKSETLTALAEWTQPSSTVRDFRKLEAEANMSRPLSRTEFAALCLVSFVSTLLAAMTVIPVFGIVCLIADSRIAWRAASLMLTVPTISVFAPRSDVVYAFSATLLLWMLIAGWIALSPGVRWLCSLLAGAVAFVSLTISLAHLPVLVAGAAFAGLSLKGADRPLLKQMMMSSLLMIGTFVVLCATWTLVTECSLFSVWKMNLANHAAFYDQSARTWWKWVFVNPAELAIALGLPITVFCAYGFVRCLRMSGRFAGRPEKAVLPTVALADARAAVSQNAVNLVLATTGTWVLLWLSGKNMGESARLWCFLTPWFVMTGTFGLSLCQRMACNEEPSASPTAPSFTLRVSSSATGIEGAHSQRDWLLLLIAQMVVCTITVGRVSGYLELWH